MKLLAGRAVAAVIGSTFLMSGCIDGESSGQPHEPSPGSAILTPSEHGGILVVPRAVAFTDGLEVIKVTEPVEIMDVGILDNSSDLLFLGASLSFQKGGTIAHQYLEGYPPTGSDLGRVVPAVGATLDPLDEGEHPPLLLVGLKAQASGVLTREAIYVDYRANSEYFRAVFPARLALCTEDVAETVERCSELTPR